MSRMIKWLTVAMLVLGAAALPSAASAQRWHGGWHRGGWGWGAAGFGLGLGLAASPWGWGPGFYGGPYYASAGPWGCWRTRRVWTPWGWRWRRVNVCF